MYGINIDHIGDDLMKAYEDGYEQGKRDVMKQEWISVKDRLPPDGKKPYLTCRKTVKGRTVIESRYLHTSYESPCVAYWEGKKNGEVTHWMPLPEPPKTK